MLRGSSSFSRQTTWELLQSHGVDRRSFLSFCMQTAAALGLPAVAAGQVVRAMETKPRIPVLWLHGLECTCCSESFIRSSHPIAQDIILNMVSLDYDDTLQAAAGHQAEEIRKRIMKEYKGEYLLAVEGNAPTKDGGVYCTVGGVAFRDILIETAENAKAIVAWGSCASNGCVQSARPNPTGAEPVRKTLPGRTVINVPGCPPIGEVMTGVLAHILTFDKLPDLDRQGRPMAYYSHRVHDKCYRRTFFDAGMFVERWDDDGARNGWCLYKMGCKGPTTYNACATVKWNCGVSFPIQSGHGCFGCSEADFWDTPVYSRVPNIVLPGAESTAENFGIGLAALTAGGAAAHLIQIKARQAAQRKTSNQPPEGGGSQ